MIKRLSKHRQMMTLIATILGSSVVLLDGYIVNLALHKIGVHLHASFSVLQWIVDGYTLTLSALILLGGSLGDIFGRKRVYLIGLVGFAVSSLFCAAAPSALFLIIARIVQGIFGALLVPGGLSIIDNAFELKDRGKAIGRWTAWTSAAVVAGPLVGGVILDVASWRWIFIINLPIALICLLIALPSIAESKDKIKRRVDWLGAALAALSLAGITYGLIEGPVSHWSVSIVAALIVGVLIGVTFVFYEAYHPDPMVNLTLFKSRNFSGSNLMTFGMYGALSGFTVALAIYMQQYVGFSSLKTGLSTLPVSFLMFLFAGRVGGLSSKFGPRIFMTIGPILAGIGILSLYQMHHGSSYLVDILPGVLIFGSGLVLTVSPLTTTVMTSVKEEDSGIASGINNAVSRAAGLIVVALLGLLGASSYYHFAILLSAGMAVAAGVISYLVVEDHVVTGLPKRSVSE